MTISIVDVIASYYKNEKPDELEFANFVHDTSDRYCQEFGRRNQEKSSVLIAKICDSCNIKLHHLESNYREYKDILTLKRKRADLVRLQEEIKRLEK